MELLLFYDLFVLLLITQSQENKTCFKSKMSGINAYKPSSSLKLH